MKITIVEMELIGAPQLLGWRRPIEGGNFPPPQKQWRHNCKHTSVVYAEETEQFSLKRKAEVLITSRNIVFLKRSSLL